MKMTKKDLLEHGILEQYVLGELDDAQLKRVEELIANDTELKARLETIESSFEQLALENAIAPPDTVKEQLLGAIKTDNLNVISIPKPDNNKLYIGIAASIAAFFLLGSIWLYSELNAIKNQLNVVKEENSVLKKDLQSTMTSLEETNTWYVALSNPNAQQYILKGNTLAPDAKIVSYVNHQDKSVIVNAKQLPELDEDHDYQMWADVDGKMIDMGVIPRNKDLIAMTYIPNAESLNITIEPIGGNDHPTVERLISNVYLE